MSNEGIKYFDGAAIRNEREIGRRRRSIIATLAHNSFENTNLVKSEPLDDKDIAAILDFYIQAAFYAHPKVFPNSFWEHIRLASLYFKHIASQTDGEIADPLMAEAAGLLHDVGSLVDPATYGKKDVEGMLLTQYAGIRSDLQEMMPSVFTYLGVEVPSLGIVQQVSNNTDLLPAQRGMQVTDMLAKRNSGGYLRSPEQTYEAVRNNLRTYKAPYAPWATQRRGLQALAQGQEFSLQLFADNIAWLRELGIDFSAAADAVEEEFRLPLNQEWLQAVQDSQQQGKVALEYSFKK
jgi:hypothetical protein